jgi:hypothetical protein
MVAGAYLPASQNTSIIDIALGAILVPEEGWGMSFACSSRRQFRELKEDDYSSIC